MAFTTLFWRLPSGGNFFMARMRKSSRMLTIIGFLCLFGTCRNINATNYFNWDVETLSFDFGVNGNGNTAVFVGASSQDCTVGHTGNCSMKLIVHGADGNNQPLGTDSITTPSYPFAMVGGPSVYYRWWMKIQPGFTWGGPTQKTKSSRTIVPGGQGGYTGYIGAAGFWLGECAQGAPGNDPCSMINYNLNSKADGVWHEYIMRVKANTTTSALNAEFQAWVDGVLVGSQIGNFRLSQDTGANRDAWGGWMIRPYFQLGSQSGGGTMYLDDFSTDDSWNSLIGGSPISVPNPPTNLRIP